MSDWTCPGQTDLTDLVDTEHIPGSMPASDRERDAARQAFYDQYTQGRAHE